MATVSLRGLTKGFGESAAVDHLSLEIGDGEFVSLLGPSGCGKTTTLRLIAGFLRPDEGEIRAADRVISSPMVLVAPEHRHMSMIFQSYAVWPHMTVAQNIAYGLKFKKLTKQEIETKVAKLLRLVHLADFKNRYPGELSGGQQQRVALARALVVEPQILLMDEPLSNLDANLREEMRFEIRRLHEEFGITTVYVTHDQAEAMATSDRIAVLNHGRIAQVGRPTEIFNRPATRFVAEFIGKANLLSGRLEDGDQLRLAEGLTLTVATGSRPAETREPVSVCLRPHHIELTADPHHAQTLASRGYNQWAGVVERCIHFGDSVDYTVELAPQGLAIRVISAPSRLYEKGEHVYALALPEHCIVVAED